MSTDSLADAHELLDQGFRFVAYGHDLVLLRTALRTGIDDAARIPSQPHDRCARPKESVRMPKQVIRTDSAGPPLGAYSQGIRAGDFIFVSGCGPIDAVTSQVRGETVEEQTEVVLDNITAILAAGGAALADVVKATVHLADETEFPEFNEVYSRAHARAAAGANDRRQRASPGAGNAGRDRRDGICRGIGGSR